MILRDGTLLLSDETNKEWDDTGPWKQKVAIWRSTDLGHTCAGHNLQLELQLQCSRSMMPGPLL